MRLLIPILTLACQAAAYAQSPARVIRHAPTEAPARTPYLIYLHGRIVEELGPSAVSPEFGSYQYLGNCNEVMRERFGFRLHGDVLSIYDASDPIGGSCNRIFEGSPELGERREIRLETGLGHGFLFRPLPAWVRPATAWARGDT